MLEFVLFFFGMPLAITLLYNYCEKQKKRKALLKRLEQAKVIERQAELEREQKALAREQMASDPTCPEYRREHVLPKTIEKWQSLHDKLEKQLDTLDALIFQ